MVFLPRSCVLLEKQCSEYRTYACEYFSHILCLSAKILIHNMALTNNCGLLTASSVGLYNYSNTKKGTKNTIQSIYFQQGWRGSIFYIKTTGKIQVVSCRHRSLKAALNIGLASNTLLIYNGCQKESNFCKNKSDLYEGLVWETRRKIKRKRR